MVAFIENAHGIQLFLMGMVMVAALICLVVCGAAWQDARLNNAPGKGGDRRYMIRFRYQDWSGLEKRWKHTFLAQHCENIEERHALLNAAVIGPPADLSHLTNGLNQYPRFAMVFDTYRAARDTYIHYEVKKMSWMEAVHNWKNGPVVVEIQEERTYYKFFKGWYTLHAVELS